MGRGRGTVGSEAKLFPLLPGEKGRYCETFDIVPIGSRLGTKDCGLFDRLEALDETLPRWTCERVAQFLRPAKTFGYAAAGRTGQMTPGELVGYGLAWNTDPHTTEIRRLFVHPCARNQGVGSRLLACLIKAAGPADQHYWTDIPETDLDTQKAVVRMGWQLQRGAGVGVRPGHYRYLYCPGTKKKGS